MRRTYERGTKPRISFSGGPHTPANMADSMEEVNVGVKMQEMACLLCCTALYFAIFEALWDFHRLFGSRNSPTTDVLHTICHVYRGMWPAREPKPRFGATLELSAHDCGTCLFHSISNKM